MPEHIPYGRQDISDADVKAVIDVLRSDWLTQGPAVPFFEKSVAKYCGASYAVAVNSATSALHIACLALGLGKGDILWTSPITFVASANCGLYCGASIDFVDIDPQTYNMSVAALEEKLIKAANQNRLPKVVVPVHFAGQACDMKGIGELGKRYGFKIIEDASHAIGGKYNGEPIGNCRYSDITVFSFHPVKIITTAEGGMAITNDGRLAKCMQLLRSHGITREISEMSHDPDGPWYYQQIDLGYNYRMTDLQAALGGSQMHRLDEFVSRRHELAKRYDEKLMALPVITPRRDSAAYSGMHLYAIRLKLDGIRQTRLQVFEQLRERGIGVNIHYIPVHTQPYYQRMGFIPSDFPNAIEYYANSISLPIYSALSDAKQDKVIEALRKVLGNN